MGTCAACARAALVIIVRMALCWSATVRAGFRGCRSAVHAPLRKSAQTSALEQLPIVTVAGSGRPAACRRGRARGGGGGG